MRERLGLEGKAALVVGGGQGIGEATCLAFADAGCRVTVLDIDLNRAQAMAARIEAQGGTAIAVCGDALDEASLVAAIRHAADQLGGLDVMATIVGSSGFSLLLDTSTTQWDIEQQANLRFAFIAAKCFTELKVAQGGTGAIAFVSSGSGIVSASRHAAYGAAKAGLIHLVKTMALEWAEHGIRVNSVAPGPIATPRLPDSEKWDEAIRQSPMPMKHRGRPEDIANALLFLCSDMAAYITGQTLSVDGGVTVGNLLPLPGALKPRPGSD